MKKLLNRISTSGKLEVNDFENEDEQFATHFRKSTTLPADTKDTSENIKIKKSMKMSLSPRSASMDIEEPDFSKKKNSSSGIKNDKNDKDKLTDSDDKALKKSASLRLKNSSSLKNSASITSPAFKSLFSEHELLNDDGGASSDDSLDDEVPRSRGSSMHDDEFVPVPAASRPFTPPSMRATSPQASSPRATSPMMTQSTSPRAASPMVVGVPTTPRALSPVPNQPTTRATSPIMLSPYGQVPSMSPLSNSIGAPPPSPRKNSPRIASPTFNAQPAPVVSADDFDLRFGGQVTPVKQEGDHKTALNKESTHKSAEQLLEEPSAEHDEDDEPVMVKSRSGLFSFGNKSRKLKS